MSHSHSIYDTDLHFVINPNTRNIDNASGKTTLVQYDHNSERFTFEIPRMIDGHDMSMSDLVQIHYVNTSSASKSTYNSGVYIVDDLQLSPGSEDVVIFSWLVSGNATGHVGKLEFGIRFVCDDGDGKPDYIWNTATHTGMSIISSIYNGNVVTEEYPDVIAQWDARIKNLEKGGVDADIEVDTEMSDESENPVQNKVVKKYVDDEINELEIKSSQDYVDESLHKTLTTALQKTTELHGDYVVLNDVASDAVNPTIVLESDTVDDFSNVTVRITNENLIPKLYDEGTVKKEFTESGIYYYFANTGYINASAGTATDDISRELAHVYLPKGVYTLSGTWTNNTEDGHLSIQALAEDGTVLTLTDTSGLTNVDQYLNIENPTGQYYTITLEIKNGSVFASTTRIWGLRLQLGSISNRYVEGITLRECKANSIGMVDSLPALSPEMIIIADNKDVNIRVLYDSVDPIYNYGLPVLELTGDISGIGKDKTQEVTLSYKYKDMSGTCGLRWQGSSSLAYPKKNYTITFDNRFEAKEGWGSQKKYCLKANYIDHTHARNLVSAQLWGQIVKSRTNQNTTLNALVNGGAVDGFPILIKINDNFQGLYTFNIPKDEWMFGMDGNSTTPQAFVCADIGCEVTQFKDTNVLLDSKDFELEFNSSSYSEDSIKTDLSNLITQAIDADTNGLTDEHPLNNMIDWDSAIDYYILTVLIGGLDMYMKNYILATYDGSKWFFSAYDMDSSYGMYWNGLSFVRANSGTTFEDLASKHTLFKIIKEQKTAELVSRYNFLTKNSAMHEGNIDLLFSNFCAPIPSIVYDEDVRLWPLTPSSSVSNLNQILNWYRNRITAMNAQIESLK